MPQIQVSDSYGADVPPGSKGWARVSTESDTVVYLDAATLLIRNDPTSDRPSSTAYADAYLEMGSELPPAYSESEDGYSHTEPWGANTYSRDYGYHVADITRDSEFPGSSDVIRDIRPGEQRGVERCLTDAYDSPEYKLDAENLYERDEPCIAHDRFTGFVLNEETLVVTEISGRYTAYADIEERVGRDSTGSVDDGLYSREATLQFNEHEATFDIQDYLSTPDDGVVIRADRDNGPSCVAFRSSDGEEMLTGIASDVLDDGRIRAALVPEGDELQPVEVAPRHAVWSTVAPIEDDHAVADLFEEVQ
jgi:hypothetical protein